MGDTASLDSQQLFEELTGPTARFDDPGAKFGCLSGPVGHIRQSFGQLAGLARFKHEPQSDPVACSGSKHLLSQLPDYSDITIQTAGLPSSVTETTIMASQAAPAKRQQGPTP